MVEVLIVLIVISVLVAFVAVVPRSLIVNAEDQERYDDIDSLSRRLETVYWRQQLGGPWYPGTTQIVNTLQNSTYGFEAASYKAPGGTDMSVIPANGTSMTNPGTGGQPSTSEYIYQPFRRNGTICKTSTAADPCVLYNLYYREAKTNTVKIVRSQRRQ